MTELQIVPAAGKNVSPQYVEMKVPLYSFGCEKKVKKALAHLRGIHSVHVDYYQQKVTVWGICNREDVLYSIRKKRRKARFWDQTESEDKAMVEETVALEINDSEPVAARGRRFKFRKSWKKLFPLSMYLL
ncbi:heavy metal-associated isoprenylated plant protein 28 [Phalaenopsis equestris]|uniref:heavy metal-associated isoprenylated plant protein 28 n=1 Tax=Phalaenopsis equestris TaxID=78828 RepID=UPI0009E1B34E|nr:heavy metal-associated isoprenylated plant protein 28 [Phalaenopsis equestris]